MLHRYLHIARTLTPRKAWNAFRMYASFLASRIAGKTMVWGRPVAMSIEPGTACNLRCPQCPSGLRQFTRDTGQLEPELFSRILSQVSRHLCSLTLYFQGEPYLNRHFTDLVKMAAAARVYTITSTNGHYLDETTARKTVASGLGELIVSIDGTTQESYAAYRVGGRLEKVIAGTKNVLRARAAARSRSPHVVWQFVVFRHNEHELPAIRKMARETGVDELRIKTAQVYDYRDGHALIPEAAGYRRYEKTANGGFSISNPMYNHCWRMWRSCVITWKGEVVPCCFDKDAAYRLGDVSNKPFAEIWRSPAYHGFRKQVLTARRSIDICTNCSEGSKVWA